MYRRATIAAAATALTLVGGGTALAATAGLFDGSRSSGAGTLPAVTSPDQRPGTEQHSPSSGTRPALPGPSADHDDDHLIEHEQGGEVEDDD